MFRNRIGQRIEPRVAAPCFAYYVMFAASAPRLLDALAVIQAGAVVWYLGRKLKLALRAVLLGAVLMVSVLVMAAAATFVPGPAAGYAGLAVSGCFHAGAYLSLLCWFSGSLRPGREPVVTLLARRIRASMPDKVVQYTRQVTIAWCVFFAAQIATSAGLLLMAPRSSWFMFITMLNLPLLAAMTVAEFGCRYWLFRHEPRTSLFGTLAAMRHIRSSTGNRS
jgi:uncharacterized membrane protein